MIMALRDRKTGEPLGPKNEGLECRVCGCRHFWTVYTRSRSGWIERRKECRHCAKRYTTFEKIEF